MDMLNLMNRDNAEDLPTEAGTDAALISAETVREIARNMAGQIGALAEMLRITNERMAAMEAAIRTLEKVTPQQAAEINRRIRERAAEICMEYRMTVPAAVRDGRNLAEMMGEAPRDSSVTAVAAAIRKDLRIMTGAKTAREIARCDFATVTEAIAGWEDYEAIRRIRKGGGKHG